MWQRQVLATYGFFIIFSLLCSFAFQMANIIKEMYKKFSKKSEIIGGQTALLAIEALTIAAWQAATAIRQQHTPSIFVAYMVASFWRITTCNECVYSHRMAVLIPHGHYQLDIYGCAAAAHIHIHLYNASLWPLWHCRL